MTAEAIARVCADLRSGRFVNPQPDDPPLRAYAEKVTRGSATGPVVDATALYHSLVARDEPVYIYEDHPCIAPPWDWASICYRNEHGNVAVMTMLGAEWREEGAYADATADEIQADVEVSRSMTQPAPWQPAEPVDWSRVRWIIDTLLFLGGRRGDGRPFQTMGPLHMWRFAVYDDGTPADLHWLHLVPDYPMEHWDMAHLVLLGALNFMNCRNVDLVEPHRPRPEAKRIARTGVRVSTINVFPAGRSPRGGQPTGAGVPLTSVRGNFAHYGACCSYHAPRGLLFGKLEGRYWRPQHARGTAELGEVRSDYQLHPVDPAS
jgi:hypothetical protein